MKIRFLEDRRVKDVEGKLFKKDQVYDLSESSCAHWISRGVAEKVGSASKTAKPSKVETATARAPETTRSPNVPGAAKPPPPTASLTREDVFGKEGSK